MSCASAAPARSPPRVSNRASTRAGSASCTCWWSTSGPYAEGEHIFREGDPFDAIAAVRAGTVKTYVTDSEGREQVLGFFLPGEVIGLNAISQARYPCNAVALDSVMLCRFSFPDIAALATRMPGLQQQLFRLLSQDIGKAALLAGNFTADERMAAFLVSLSRRYAARGFSRDALPAHDDAHRHRQLPAARLRKRQPRVLAACRTPACCASTGARSSCAICRSSKPWRATSCAVKEAGLRFRPWRARRPAGAGFRRARDDRLRISRRGLRDPMRSAAARHRWSRAPFRCRRHGAEQATVFGISDWRSPSGRATA